MTVTRTIFICLLLSAIAGCASGGSNPAARDTAGPPSPVSGGADLPGRPRLPDIAPFTGEAIRVGLLLPLSGGSKEVGEALLDAASLALFDSYDPRLELIPFDTRGTPEGAARAAAEAAAANVEIAIGPLFASSIQSAAPTLQERGIRMIGFSNDRSIAGGGIYLLSFMPDQEVRRVMAYAAAEGYQRFGALLPDTPYGDEVLASFGKSANELGVGITALEFYQREAAQVFEPVKRLANYDTRRRAYVREEAFLKRLDDDFADEILKGLEAFETIGDPVFDAVLIPEGGTLLSAMAPVLPFYEIDPKNVKFLGTGLWDDPAIFREIPLRSGWFAAPPVEGFQSFAVRFETLFGSRPPRIATLAYDATALVALLARNEIRADRFSREALTDVNGFSGIDGIFRFRSDGIAERGLAVMEITGREFKTISPAPESFEK